MRCSDALLIHLQGSQANVDDRRNSSAHIARCPDCAGAIDDLDHDDTTAASLLRDLAIRSAGAYRGTRVALVVIAALETCLALPWLFGVNALGFMDDSVQQTHLTRDGAIGLFVGATGLLIAYRPRYATSGLITATVGVALQLVAGAIDENQADVGAAFELLHLLTLAILILAAVLAGTRRRIGPPKREQSSIRLARSSKHPN